MNREQGLHLGNQERGGAEGQVEIHTRAGREAEKRTKGKGRDDRKEREKWDGGREE